MIDELIAEEYQYYEPMLTQMKAITPELLAQWRDETIAERQKRISLETFDYCEGIVKYGPFKGLKLNRDTWWSVADLGSQCLGFYEKELLDIISVISPSHYDYFIDIGAADGYYAIGMLAAKKVNHVICFEQSDTGRQAIHQNWCLNNAPGHIKIHAEANALSLQGLPTQATQNALILIDIEGAEFDLLSPQVINDLKHCDIIIEIHHWVDNFIDKYTALLKCADKLFDIDIIRPTPRNTENMPELRCYPDDNRLLLVSERRPALMRFLKLTSRTRR